MKSSFERIEWTSSTEKRVISTENGKATEIILSQDQNYILSEKECKQVVALYHDFCEQTRQGIWPNLQASSSLYTCKYKYCVEYSTYTFNCEMWKCEKETPNFKFLQSW